MRELQEIAADLKSYLSSSFQTVRLSTEQTPEQFAQDVDGMNPEKLPGVIIAFHRMDYQVNHTIREVRFHLILTDEFHVDDEAKNLSLLDALEDLLTLFPAGGTARNGVFYLPEECVQEHTGGNYAAITLKIVAKQGI